jgi:hypothetical protein
MGIVGTSRCDEQTSLMASGANAVADDGAQDEEHAEQQCQVHEICIGGLGGVVARRSAEADEEIGDEGGTDDEGAALRRDR